MDISCGPQAPHPWSKAARRKKFKLFLYETMKSEFFSYSRFTIIFSTTLSLCIVAYIYTKAFLHKNSKSKISDTTQESSFVGLVLPFGIYKKDIYYSKTC